MAETLNCPKCKAPLEAHEVSTGITVHHCPSCFGVLYRTDELAVALKLSGASPARFDCPRCHRPMETATAYDGKLEVDRCQTCSVLWFDAGEIQILRKLSGVENLAGKTTKEAPAASPLGPAIAGAAAAIPAGVLSKLKKQSKAQSPDGPPEMANAHNPDADRAPTVTLDGRDYRHFQTSVPVTTSVLGEFPWVAQVGDSARMRDFICPPYMLSQEVSATESVWSVGEYIEPDEVWSAFARPGFPPAKIGVAPAQPNPWAAELPAMWRVFWVGAAVCVSAYLLFAMFSSSSAVYEGSFSIAGSELERSRVGDVFDVKGRTSNLEILLDTNLDMHWAYMSMALINADTDQAFDFGREISYYHGYDGDGSWSEGRSYGTVYVPSVPSGRYYLRIEPETDAPLLNFRVRVKRDVPLRRVPLIAVVMLFLPVFWAGLRYNVFENSRWMESDHPRVSSDEDDE